MHFTNKNIANCLALYCRHLHSHATRHMGLCGETKQHESNKVSGCNYCNVEKKNDCNAEFMHEVSTHIPVTGWLLIIMIKFRKCTSWAHGAYF